MNRLLSVKEVAALLQTSRVQVRRMIQSGELAALKVGREYRCMTERSLLCSATSHTTCIGI